MLAVVEKQSSLYVVESTVELVFRILIQADGPLNEAECLLLQLLMISGDMKRLEKRMRLAGKPAIERAMSGTDGIEDEEMKQKLKAAIEGADSPAGKLAAKSVSIRCRSVRADEHSDAMLIEWKAIGVPQRNTCDYHLA